MTTSLRIEMVKGFRYITHTVLSTNPEDDALDRVRKYAKEMGIENPKVIGWDHNEKDVIPCFGTDGETMDVYIACK